MIIINNNYMENINIKELVSAINEIQMARPPYVLDKFVVNCHHTEEQRYAHCVLELSIAYDNLRRAKLSVEKAEIELKEIRGWGRKAQIEKELKEIDVEQTKRAMLGALREFDYLYSMWISFPKRYTRDELNNAQPLEFETKLRLQAQHDINATGRISVGNQEGLRMIGMATFPQLDVARSVEKRFLEVGKLKVLIAIPTEKKAEKGVPCIEGLQFVKEAEIRLYNVFGRSIDDAYTNIVETAIEDKADYIMTVEDDTFPPADAMLRLFNLIKENPKTAVGAWYPMRREPREGVPIILKAGIRQPLVDDGKIHEVYTLPMGCSIFPVEMFMQIPFPWFKTTSHLSQDSFFSQLARDHGWKLLVDTSIKCKHIDRETGKIYE